MDNWRKMIDSEKLRTNDFSNEVHCTIDDIELNKNFDSDFGGVEGTPFILWTEERVYFALEYDGSEYVGSVPRNPRNEKFTHL